MSSTVGSTVGSANWNSWKVKWGSQVSASGVSCSAGSLWPAALWPAARAAGSGVAGRIGPCPHGPGYRKGSPLADVHIRRFGVRSIVAKVTV
jgi:hypothetical protein